MQDNDQINSSCNVENTADETEHLNDDWTEDNVEIPAGETDTMLTATDFLKDRERAHIYNIAPGEGSIPLSIFKDKYSEELAYPGIFLGQKRPENEERLVDVHYSDICKSEFEKIRSKSCYVCRKYIFQN